MPDKPTDHAHSAAEKVITTTHSAIEAVNDFTRKTFVTRGGRIGSGMGSVVEALWGFHINRILKADDGIDYELGWIYGHEYNDFACVLTDQEWNPETKQGELFRIEVKSMVASADESKAHFDRLQHEFADDELLAVFLWDWKQLKKDSRNVYPAILDYFVGYALPIAELRDLLHLDRGGTFVESGPHKGEPLNASGMRERRTGPESAKGSGVSYAANFGGLLRMLGSRGRKGKEILKKEHASDATKARFIDFMARNFPRVAKAIK
jgi:hypothetical protein